MIRWHITTFIFLHINIHHHSDNAKNAQMYTYYICAYTYEYIYILYIHIYICLVRHCAMWIAFLSGFGGFSRPAPKSTSRIPTATPRCTSRASDGTAPSRRCCWAAERIRGRGIPAETVSSTKWWMEGIKNFKKLWMLNSHQSANQTAITVLLNHVEPVFHHSPNMS